MGAFTSKLILGMLAGGFFVFAGANLFFTGEDTLKVAKDYVKETTKKLLTYEENEGKLLEKLTKLQKEADSRIQEANDIISDRNATIEEKTKVIETLTLEKQTLSVRVTNLEENVLTLQSDLEKAKSEISMNQEKIILLQQQYDEKVVELTEAKIEIEELNEFLKWAEEKSNEYTKYIKHLEKELKKANKQVEDYGIELEIEREKSKDAVPLTEEELDNINMTLTEVNG